MLSTHKALHIVESGQETHFLQTTRVLSIINEKGSNNNEHGKSSKRTKVGNFSG